MKPVEQSSVSRPASGTTPGPDRWRPPADARVGADPITGHFHLIQAGLPKSPLPQGRCPTCHHPSSDLTQFIGEERARELTTLRAEFNRPSAGAWGILYDPNTRHWTALHGSGLLIYARSARELRDRLIDGSRSKTLRMP